MPNNSDSNIATADALTLLLHNQHALGAIEEVTRWLSENGAVTVAEMQRWPGKPSIKMLKQLQMRLFDYGAHRESPFESPDDLPFAKFKLNEILSSVNLEFGRAAKFGKNSALKCNEGRRSEKLNSKHTISGKGNI